MSILKIGKICFVKGKLGEKKKKKADVKFEQKFEQRW